MLRILSIWCTIFFCGSYAVVPLDKFFGYGPQSGDQKLSQEFYVRSRRPETNSLILGRIAGSSRVDLNPPLTIYGNKRDYVIVKEDGSIMVDSGAICVYCHKIDLARGGVYWRKSNSSVDLEKARQEIGSAFPAHNRVDLKWALIVTWDRVSPSNSSFVNTFQGILSTDGIRSFAIFYYNIIQWSRNRKGIFRIDQQKIYEPNSLCALPPKPEIGFCTAVEYIPGSLAQCLCRTGYTTDTTYSLTCSKLPDNTLTWTGTVPACIGLIPSTTQMPPIVFPLGSKQRTTQLPTSSSAFINTSSKLCPLPPTPQNGICEKKAYTPGSLAKCNCLPNYRNVNPNSHLYCVFAEDGTLFWSGGMLTCMNSST